jgi:hypothetical protein
MSMLSRDFGACRSSSCWESLRNMLLTFSTAKLNDLRLNVDPFLRGSCSHREVTAMVLASVANSASDEPMVRFGGGYKWNGVDLLRCSKNAKTLGATFERDMVNRTTKNAL